MGFRPTTIHWREPFNTIIYYNGHVVKQKGYSSRQSREMGFKSRRGTHFIPVLTRTRENHYRRRRRRRRSPPRKRFYRRSSRRVRVIRFDGRRRPVRHIFHCIILWSSVPPVWPRDERHYIRSIYIHILPLYKCAIYCIVHNVIYYYTCVYIITHLVRERVSGDRSEMPAFTTNDCDVYGIIIILYFYYCPNISRCRP